MSAYATTSSSRQRNPNTAGHMESELHAAIARLSVEDIEALAQRSHGRATDGELALRLAREEAANLRRFNRDRALAQSLAAGVAQGVRAPVETRPTGPRVVPTAPANAGGREARPTPIVTSTPLSESTVEGGGFWSTLSSWIWGPSVPARHTCVICQETISGEGFKAGCGHYCDKGCILELFEAATRDETLYPPRCCRVNIPVPPVEALMTETLRQRFREKAQEFGTLKRVYCSNPKCSAFLGPQRAIVTVTKILSAANVYTCKAQGCGSSTCPSCKKKWTFPHVCQSDEGDEDVLKLGERAQWARCPGCAALVELTMGCYHMTCRCKTEFCYLCKATWKTCTCVQWDERRLFQVAEERVDARLRVDPPRPRPLHPVVQRDLGELVPVINQARHALPRPQAAQLPRIVTTRTEATPPARLVTIQVHHEHRNVAGGWDYDADLDSDSDVPELEDTTSNTRHRSDNPTLRAHAGATKPSNSPHVPTATSSQQASSQATRPHLSSDGGWKAFQSQPKVIGEEHNPNVKENGVLSVRDRLVREAMEHLRNNHECAHDRWHYRPGGGRCENCHHNLPSYLFRCRQCQLVACNRCRRNRL